MTGVRGMSRKLLAGAVALALLLCSSAAFAQTGIKISGLPPGSTLAGPEEFPVVQSGTTVGITANQIKSFVGSGVPPIASGQLLANISGATTTPIGLSLSNYLDSVLSGTQGSVIYRSGAGWTALPPGLNGQIFASGGSGANPSWITVGGTGTVTLVNCGTGLTGGPITTTGSCALAPIGNNLGLVNTSGGGAAPIATSISSWMDSALGSTQGAIIYRNATNWVVLLPGTNGQFLETLGAGANPTWAAAVGSGTVTNLATGACLTGGPITTTGTVSGLNPVNPQTGTTYTIANGDQCKLVTFSNASSVAVGIPQAGGGGNFVAGWLVYLQNRGAGTVTITPTTSQIDGASTLTLNQNQGALLFSDGANYFSLRGIGSAGVTSVAAGLGLTTTPGTCNTGSITVTGTISECMAPNVKTGAYTIANTDQHSLLVFNSASSANFGLPQAGGGGNFLKGWSVCFENINTGLLTITPATSTIDGGGALNLAQNQGLCVYSDGSNYFTNRGIGSGGAVSITSLSSNLVFTPSPLTGSGTGAITTPINPQTGTTYAVVAADGGKLIEVSNAAAIAISLPVASTSGFGAGWGTAIMNTGTTLATITPTTSTITNATGPASSLILGPNQFAFIQSDGTNYQALIGDTNSAANNLTAHAGGGQGSALQLTARMSRVSTVTTSADSVKLIASYPGAWTVLTNSGANPMQVFGAGTDTINGVATGTGVSQLAGQTTLYWASAAGTWFSTSLGGSGSGTVNNCAATGDVAYYAASGTTVSCSTGLVMNATNILGYLGSVTTQSGTTYTLAAGDCGTIVRFNNAGAITVTLPNSLSIGCEVTAIQVGAGQVTFSAGSGATVVNAHSFTKTFGQNALVTLSVDANAGGASAHYELAGDGA